MTEQGRSSTRPSNSIPETPSVTGIWDSYTKWKVNMTKLLCNSKKQRVFSRKYAPTTMNSPTRMQEPAEPSKPGNLHKNWSAFQARTPAQHWKSTQIRD